MTEPTAGSETFVRVAVPVPLLSSLTYRVPVGHTPPVRGARVRVPLGSRIVVGCVVGVGHDADSTGSPQPASDAVKEVDEVVDAEPFLPAAVLDLALWSPSTTPAALVTRWRRRCRPMPGPEKD